MTLVLVFDKKPLSLEKKTTPSEEANFERDGFLIGCFAATVSLVWFYCE